MNINLNIASKIHYTLFKTMGVRKLNLVPITLCTVKTSPNKVQTSWTMLSILTVKRFRNLLEYFSLETFNLTLSWQGPYHIETSRFDRDLHHERVNDHTNTCIGGRSNFRWLGNEYFQYGISRFWEKYGRQKVFSTLDGAGNY